MLAPKEASSGIFSLLDTDLYKLNMQCAVLKHFPKVQVQYAFHNRTSEMRLNQKAATWLQEQINNLEELSLSDLEFRYLQEKCKYLSSEYLNFIRSLRLRPREQVRVAVSQIAGSDSVDVEITVDGLWCETILYEIPILALTSEAYFKFVDLDWSHEGQDQRAYDKGVRLLKEGCHFSEFGSRRRRDFLTQDTVVRELIRAQNDNKDEPGRLIGTSNVYLAMKHGIDPIGTVAHEWYMAIAAISQDYDHANKLGLELWLDTFGEGVLGVALTDTFGTPCFFRDFKKSLHDSKTDRTSQNAVSSTEPSKKPTFAHIYTGIRQDSGDPEVYVNMAGAFYDSLGIQGKTILFSDSLHIEKCAHLKSYAEKRNLKPSFGIGTFFSNDFDRKSDPKRKSKALNIVMKVSKAAGNHCIKISDDRGKATGNKDTIRSVKDRLGIENSIRID